MIENYTENNRTRALFSALLWVLEKNRIFTQELFKVIVSFPHIETADGVQRRSGGCGGARTLFVPGDMERRLYPALMTTLIWLQFIPQDIANLQEDHSVNDPQFVSWGKDEGSKVRASQQGAVALGR